MNNVLLKCVKARPAPVFRLKLTTWVLTWISVTLVTPLYFSQAMSQEMKSANKGQSGLEVSAIFQEDHQTNNESPIKHWGILPISLNDWHASVAYVDGGEIFSEGHLARCGDTGKIAFFRMLDDGGGNDPKIEVVLLNMRNGDRESYSIALHSNLFAYGKEGKEILKQFHFEFSGIEGARVECANNAKKLLLTFHSLMGKLTEAKLYVLVDLQNRRGINLGIYSTSRKAEVRGDVASADFTAIIAPQKISKIAKEFGFQSAIATEDLIDLAVSTQGAASMVKTLWDKKTIWAVITKPELTVNEDGTVSASHSKIIDGIQGEASFQPYAGYNNSDLSQSSTTRSATISVVRLAIQNNKHELSRCDIQNLKYVEAKMYPVGLVLLVSPRDNAQARQFYLVKMNPQKNSQCQLLPFSDEIKEADLHKATLIGTSDFMIRAELAEQANTNTARIIFSNRRAVNMPWRNVLEYQLGNNETLAKGADNAPSLMQISISGEEDATFVYYAPYLYDAHYLGYYFFQLWHQQ